MNPTTKFIRMVLACVVLSFILISTTPIHSANAFLHITSPPKDEAVPAGSPLEISGTSDDTPETNCSISVIVNDIRPYQEATPAVPGDYSEWSFTITPQYADIEEGINKITAKASCDSPYDIHLVQDPIARDYVKFYSINVTGLPSEMTDSEDGDNIVVPFGPPTSLDSE